MDHTYSDLFGDHVKQLSVNASGQASGLCPFHDDVKPSFSMNLDTGLWSCHGCGASGNAITFAKLRGLDISPIAMPESESEILQGANLQTINRLAAYLQNNLVSLRTSGRVPVFWNDDFLKRTRTGFDPEKNCLTFTHFNIEGLPVNIKWHKPINGESSQLPGHGGNRFYPLHLLRGYSTSEPLIYCEGEKDCISLLSMGLQAVTHTCGALSVPDNLTPLKDFKQIYVVFDNDPAGYDGAENTAKALSLSFPEMQVYTYEWHIKTRPGFDVTDYFLNGGNVAGFRHMMDYAIPFQDNRITDETFIKTYRKTINSKVFRDADLNQLWDWCLLTASPKRTFVNAKCGRGNKQVRLDRGQFLFSPTKAEFDLGQPKNTTWDRLRKLQNMGNIRLDKVEARTLITICKWRIYQ